jgi:hypothetical protein
LPKTDVQPANDSAFLAIHHLLSLYHRTQDEIYAVRAIVALRYIARRSPSELRAQFLLVRLCRLVGAYAWFLYAFPYRRASTELQIPMRPDPADAL